MNKLFILVLLVMQTSCTTIEPVSDAGNNDIINTLTMSCKKPYLLEQDCSFWSGAARKIAIDGFEVRISASADGKNILVMDANPYRISSYKFNPINPADDPMHSMASNNSFVIVKRILGREKIKINKVRAVKSLGNIDGYALELESDGYSVLKKYTIK